MDKNQARQIIQETFENSFDKDKFIHFIKNLFNSVEEASFSYRGNLIPDAYEQYISTLERIGKYTAGENEIDILICKLKKETSLERARTMQRNFIARYLNGSRGGKLKDAALVAFVSPDEDDWRFSLVKMDYKFEEKQDGRIKVKEEFTPARRWSFLVGKNEKSHTAQSQLVPILEDDEHSPTLAQLESAFNIEKVTKEFFEKYRELFWKTKEYLDKIVETDEKIKSDFEIKGVNTVDFSKKLLGQIVFFYFLQKKGWFGVKRDADWGTGSKQFLRELFDKKHADYDNFFDDILEPLFYEALRNDRTYDGHYYSHFKCKIPFLNGGLFDPINDYDWVLTDILFPNELFSNTYKTKEGDTGNGILDIFDRYNFTVKEDEPLEKEVAVDPEMLGKVFENLLEVKDRKSKGTYYTPREIVHYMCQQSLINYLHTELNDGIVAYKKLGDEQFDIFGNEGKRGQLDLTIELNSNPVISKENIETIIKYGEQVGENEAMVEAKGRETDTYSYKLPESIRTNAKLIDEKLANIKVCDPAIGSGAFPVGMMSEIVKARNVLSDFIKEPDRTVYYFKRDCIQNSLYGVDIDSGAVEIAKLRLWLSLVVDEEDYRTIKPLPNLDYKIICGNSLLNFPDTVVKNVQVVSEIEELKRQYFNEISVTTKKELKAQIDTKFKKLVDEAKQYSSMVGDIIFDYKTYFSEVFHEKKGFDVVIANPPYVEAKKLKDISQTLRKFYSTYSGTADLYVYFYEKGMNILRDKGVLTFISSNKFIKTSYGENLRKYFTGFKINEIIDFTDVHVFEALVASCIFSISKIKAADNKVKIAFANDTLTDFSDVASFVEQNKFFLSQNGLSEKIWQLENETNLSLKVKIEKDSITLNETGTVKIFRGVTTVYNPAFIIDDEKRKELIKEDKTNKEIIKPLLQGRNIRKWIFNKSDTYLLQTGFDTNIKKEYPSILKHLNSFKQELEVRADQGVNYWNLRACKYYSEFEKEKIIWGLTSDKWTFAYDNEKNFLPSNGYILTSKEIPIKYLLALMNSKLMEFYFGFIGIMTAGGAYTLKYETVIEFPIKKISLSEQKPFITLVDQILTITQSNDYLQNEEKQAKVKEYEHRIDNMVYKLYDLTEDEIKIVEGKIIEGK
ncbi:MAG: Eco57I restriction-modification methylase domain-containing protein [Bacteroidia bacterium]|nr:Eco57I restriction-modification methylase domain-containing protein [Bacteroidia bacterium]